MVLDKLSGSLKSTLSKITGATFVDEKLINEVVKDIQRSLLQSDVNVKLVLQISQKIKERAVKEASPDQLTKREQLVNIVYEELVEFLGGPGPKIEIKKKPFVILLVGLFGNGKTTCAGKLGKYYSTRGRKVALLSTDTWRPAAADQLTQLAESINVNVYTNKKEKNPVKIYKQFEKDLLKHDVIIVDTAGRDALNDELVEELNGINKVVKPDEVLLVMSADIGQAAQEQAQKFHDTVNVSGVVITKLDGTAKGGGALIACSVTGAPVKFIGVGEKIDDIEEFKPEGFVGQLLGMGDLEALLEKAKEAMTEEDAQDMGFFDKIGLGGTLGGIKKDLTKIYDAKFGQEEISGPTQSFMFTTAESADKAISHYGRDAFVSYPDTTVLWKPFERLSLGAYSIRDTLYYEERDDGIRSYILKPGFDMGKQ